MRAGDFFVDGKKEYVWIVVGKERSNVEGLVRFRWDVGFVKIVGFGRDPTIAERLNRTLHAAIENHLKMDALPVEELPRNKSTNLAYYIRKSQLI